MSTETQNKTVILPSWGRTITGTHDVENKIKIDLDSIVDKISQVWQSVFGRKPDIKVERNVNEEGDFSILVDNSYYIYLATVKLSDDEMFAKTVNMNDSDIGGENEVLRLALGAILHIHATYEDPPDVDEVDIAYSTSLSGIIGELVRVEVNRIMDDVWETITMDEIFKEEDLPF